MAKNCGQKLQAKAADKTGVTEYKTTLFPLASLPGSWKRRAATSRYDPAFSFLLFRTLATSPGKKATAVLKFPTSLAEFITANRLLGLCSSYA